MFFLITTDRPFVKKLEAFCVESRGEPVTDCRLLKWAECIEHHSAATEAIPASFQGLHVWQCQLTRGILLVEIHEVASCGQYTLLLCLVLSCGLSWRAMLGSRLTLCSRTPSSNRKWGADLQVWISDKALEVEQLLLSKVPSSSALSHSQPPMLTGFGPF